MIRRCLRLLTLGLLAVSATGCIATQDALSRAGIGGAPASASPPPRSAGFARTMGAGLPQTDSSWTVANRFDDNQGVQGALLFRRIPIGAFDMGNAGLAVEGVPYVIDLRGVSNRSINGVQYVSLSPGSGAYFFRTPVYEPGEHARGGRQCDHKYVVVGISPVKVDMWRIGCDVPLSFLRSSDGHNLIMSALKSGGESHYVMSPDVMGVIGPMETSDLTPEDQALIYGGGQAKKATVSKQATPPAGRLSRIQTPSAAPATVRSGTAGSSPATIKLD